MALQRPRLLIPALASDALAFGFKNIGTLAAFQITKTQFEHRISSMTSAQVWALFVSTRIIAAILRAGAIYLTVALYTGALLVTVTLFNLSHSRSRPIFVAISGAWNSARAVLIFSAKIVGVLAVVYFVLAILYAIGEGRIFVATAEVVTMFSAIALAAVAFVMSSSAYKLLDALGAMPLRDDERTRLRLVAAGCVAGSGLIYLACSKSEPRFVSIYASYPVHILCWLVMSLLSALPYALLFISFSILASTHLSTADGERQYPPTEEKPR